MLTIRKEQINILDNNSMHLFIEKMIKHLMKHFPEKFESAEPDEVISFAKCVINKAIINGIKSERSICKYINICAVYGQDFNLDPKNGWMVSILSDPPHEGQENKLDKLYDEILKKDK